MISFTVFESFSAVSPILITIGIGYMLKYLRLLGKDFVYEADRLNYLLGFPLLLFCSTVNADVRSLFSWRLVLYSLISIFIMTAIAYVVFGKISDQKKQGALTTTAFRSDILLFAVYISGRLFGYAGIATAAMLTAFISPTVTLLSILILNHLDGDNTEPVKAMQTLKTVFRNPFFAAVILGILYNWTGLPFPEVLQKPLSDIGSLAIPLAMLAIGVQLDFRQAASDLRYVVIGVIARLVIVPLIFLPGAVFLGFSKTEMSCLLAQFAAPATVSCYTFARQMNSDATLAGNIVIFSTVFSILTIFIELLILTNLNIL